MGALGPRNEGNGKHGPKSVTGSGASEHQRPATDAAVGGDANAVAETIKTSAPAERCEGRREMTGDKATTFLRGELPKSGEEETSRAGISRGHRIERVLKTKNHLHGEPEEEPQSRIGSKKKGQCAIAAGPKAAGGDDAKLTDKRRKHHGSNHERPMDRGRRHGVGMADMRRRGQRDRELRRRFREEEKPSDHAERDSPPFRVRPKQETARRTRDRNGRGGHE